MGQQEPLDIEAPKPRFAARRGAHQFALFLPERTLLSTVKPLLCVQSLAALESLLYCPGPQLI